LWSQRLGHHTSRAGGWRKPTRVVRLDRCIPVRRFGLWRAMHLKAEALHQKILRRARRLVPPQGFRAVQDALRGCRGIEVGGPSAVFQRWNLWPLYPVVEELDNYNFAPDTIWSAYKPTASRLSMTIGRTPPGRQLIGEAALMNEVKSSG